VLDIAGSEIERSVCGVQAWLQQSTTWLELLNSAL